MVTPWDEEEPVFLMLWGWSLDGERVMPLAVPMSLPLNVAPLTARFLGTMVVLKENFFWIFKGEILSARTQISMKAPFCGGYFLLWMIRRSIHTTNENMCLRCKYKISNTTDNRWRHDIFKWKLKSEKPWEGGGGKSTTTCRFTGITCMYWYFFELELNGRPKVSLY